jgi:hypothetical protein
VTVQWAAYDYLGKVANLSALPFLEKLAESGSEDDLGAGAHRARLHILARLDPEVGFSDLLEKPDYASDELVRLLESSISKIPTTKLKEGLGSPANKIKEVAAAELARRREMSAEEAEKLTKDISIPIRKIGFEELIRRGKPIDLDKIKESFSEPQDSPLWQPRRMGLLSDLLGPPHPPSASNFNELADSVILTFFQTLPPSELSKHVDWLDRHAAIAYRCLATDHYEMVSDQIRDDITQDFQRIRAATFERLDAQYDGARGLEVLKADIGKLDGFIREEFLEAALVGLASHAKASDIGIARNHLSHRRQEVREAALKIVTRFGTSEDVPALIAISRESWGALGEKAAVGALQLSSNPFEVAKAFTTSHTRGIVSIGFRWLQQDHSRPTKEFFENLLNDENAANRERAIHYLTEGLTESEMKKFLDDYLARESHYYDVVTWLDRFLYAPPPFSAMYRRRLEEKVSSPKDSA